MQILNALHFQNVFKPLFHEKLQTLHFLHDINHRSVTNLKAKFITKSISCDGNKNLRESSWFDIFVSNNSALIDFPDGNKIPGCEKFYLCFGGRRQYCDTAYRDLGNLIYILYYGVTKLGTC